MSSFRGWFSKRGKEFLGGVESLSCVNVTVLPSEGRRNTLAGEWWEGVADRAQRKGGGETEDYGSPLEELGNKKTGDMLLSPGKRRCPRLS